jgi:hypothetical protein
MDHRSKMFEESYPGIALKISFIDLGGNIHIVAAMKKTKFFVHTQLSISVAEKCR